MAFFEVEFPRTILYKGTSGRTFNTTVNTGFSGFEQRNKNWAAVRGEWQVSLITPTAFQNSRQQFLDLLNSFFLNVSGMGDGFRLFDHIDNTGTNQLLGIGDGITSVFQLVKQYTIGARTYTRTISKPITNVVTDYQGNPLPNTVVIFRNGVVDPTIRWTVDATTGLVAFGLNASNLSITAATVSGGNVVYTYTVTAGQAVQIGMRVVITGMANAGNNGTFYVTALGGGTFTVVNGAGVNATVQSGVGITDWTPAVGAQLNVNFKFHYPVRFDTDNMQIQIEESNLIAGQPLGSWASIALKEIRIAAG